MYIALYGGSFNPPTTAHHALGHYLADTFSFDQVWFLVSPQNPLKPTNGMAPFEHRLAMMKISAQDTPSFVVSDYEHRVQTRETADTLKALSVDFPSDRFVWALGADNFAYLHRWGKFEWMKDNATFIVLPREGCNNIAKASPASTLLPHLKKKSDLKNTHGWFWAQSASALTTAKQDICATKVREELRLGQRPENLQTSVLSYIRKHSLYAPLH